MGDYADDAFERDMADWAREGFPQMPNSPYDGGLEDDEDMPDAAGEYNRKEKL